MCGRSLNVREVLENDPEAYYSKEELLDPLLVMYKRCAEVLPVHLQGSVEGSELAKHQQFSL